MSDPFEPEPAHLSASALRSPAPHVSGLPIGCPLPNWQDFSISQSSTFSRFRVFWATETAKPAWSLVVFTSPLVCNALIPTVWTRLFALNLHPGPQASRGMSAAKLRTFLILRHPPASSAIPNSVEATAFYDSPYAKISPTGPPHNILTRQVFTRIQCRLMCTPQHPNPVHKGTTSYECSRLGRCIVPSSNSHLFSSMVSVGWPL